MTNVTELDLASEIEAAQSGTGWSVAWNCEDLLTGSTSSARNHQPMPADQLDSFIQYLALTDAQRSGTVDLTARCALGERHRDDDHNGVIGCMTNGLVLSLGDYLAQTIITADPAAFAVVRDETKRQGVSVTEVVDGFLQKLELPALHTREVLSEPGRTGVPLGSTTTEEQMALLRWLIDESNPAGEHALKQMSSVLKAGGLGRGLPGYGPFRTRVAHVARSGIGNGSHGLADSAVFFDSGAPRLLVSVIVTDIGPEIRGLPGIAAADDFLRAVSRACWAASVGTF